MGGKGFRTVQSFGRSTGTEWMDDIWANRPAPSWNGIPQAVAPQQYGMASGFRSNLSPWAVGAGAAGLGAAALAPEEAGAAVRPDIENVISKAISGLKWTGRSAGALESPVAKEVLSGSAKYNGGVGYFTEHGLTWRNKKDGWTPEQIAAGYRGIYDSPDTLVIPNVLGENPSAMEALWNPHGIDDRSWYMPIAPYKKGFKGVTLYDPEASKVERLLKSKRYWEGESTSSIFTPTLGERSKSIGSGTLSAVNTPAFENTIPGLDVWRKRNLPAAAGTLTGLSMLAPSEAGAAGLGAAALAPEEAEAAVENDFIKNFVKAAGKAARKEPGEEVVLGETPEEAFRLLKEIYPRLNDPVARIVFPHGVISRADQMTALQQADLYAHAYRDETLKAVRNKPGNGRSEAALWHQGQKISSFFPVKEQDGHPLILTGMPKKTKDIQNYLVENRWGLGGRTEDPSILVTPRSLGIEVPSGQPVRTFSAVSPNYGNTIGDLTGLSKKLPAAAGTLTGLSMLAPSEAGAAGMGGAGHASHTASEPGFWPGMARQFGLGTRGVLEGLGSAATLGFAEPGVGISDLLGLPAPETDWERWRVGLNRGASDAMASITMGTAAARMSPSPLVRGIGRELADKPMQSAGIGGLLGALGEVQPDIDLDDIGGLLGLLTFEEKDGQDSPRRKRSGRWDISKVVSPFHGNATSLRPTPLSGDGHCP